jgi:hypothetical protein
VATPTDRSVGLGELAARAQTGSTASARARGTSNCRNPECQNGLTPGLVAVGGGSKGAPIFGAGGVGAKSLMRWAWVNCLACNPPEGARKAGAVYKHLNLTEAQIAQRAQLASTKARYQPDSLSKLARPSAGVSLSTSVADSGKLAEMAEANKALNARLDEMLKQNAEMLKNNAEMTQTLSRMTMQIAALLEDNAKLRKYQEDKKLSEMPATPGADKTQ